MKKIKIFSLAILGLLLSKIAYCQSTQVHVNGTEGVILVVKDTTIIIRGFIRFTPTLKEVKRFEEAFAKVKDSDQYKLYKRQYIGYYNLKSYRKMRVILIAPSCAEEHPTWVNDELIIFDEDRIAGIIFDPLNGICGKIEIHKGGW